MKTRALFASLGGLLFAAAALSGVAGCGNDNPQPPTTSSGTFTSSGTSGGTGGTSDTGGGGAGGTSNTGGSGGTSTGGTGGTGGNCDGPNGCYACPPKVDKELLNACTAAQCGPFDNVARLPLYNNGNLPPLP